MKKRILLSVFILSCVGVFAQEKQQSAEVFFRQGVSQIQLDFKGNKKNLDEFISFITCVSF